MKRTVWAYNLDNQRPDQEQVDRELDAILSTDPMALVVVEAIGNHLQEHRGYEKLASSANASRQNIAMYVDEHAERYPRAGLNWLDLDTTWNRTEGPGIHPPRSFGYLDIEGLLLIGVHQQPKGTNTSNEGQAEGIGALSRLIQSDDGPALAIGDFNRTPREFGPGPRALAKRIGGRTIGTRIDCAVGRQVRGRISYPTQVRDVRLRSDHGHAVRIELEWSR